MPPAGAQTFQSAFYPAATDIPAAGQDIRMLITAGR